MASSPVLTNGNPAWLETTVIGPGSLSFHWQALTQDDSTRRVLVDGRQLRQLKWNPPRFWRRDTVEIPAGLHTIRFETSGPCGAGRRKSVLLLVPTANWSCSRTWAQAPTLAALSMTVV